MIFVSPGTRACANTAGEGECIQPPIPGTTISDGRQAAWGYALNRMCFSFNEAANRADFKADEGWGIPTLPPFRGQVDLSWHIIGAGRQGVRPHDSSTSPFDLKFMDSLPHDPEWATQFSMHERGN